MKSPGDACLPRLGVWGALAAVLLLLPMICSPGHALEKHETKSILILNSYDTDLPLIRAITSGIRSANGMWNINYFTESMDICRFPGEEHLQALETLYRRKYRSEKPDLIIAVGNHAVNFLAQRSDALFSGVPVAYAELADSEPQRKLPPSFRGFRMPTDIRGTVDTALRLHPGTKHIAVVSGRLALDRLFEAQARRELAEYAEKFDIIWVTNLSAFDSLEKIDRLPDKTIILFLSFLKGDFRPVEPGKPFVSQLSSRAHAPLYTLWSTQVGKGMVGGHVLDFEEAGIRLGRTAVSILGGAQLPPAAVGEEGLLQYRFDWRELRRWGIAESNLPSSSSVEFRKPPIWIEYRDDVLIILIVFALQALFIVALLINGKSLRRTQAALEASEQRFSSFFRNLPIGCIIVRFVHDADGAIVDMEIQDANFAVSVALNRPFSELIGARVCTLLDVATLRHLDIYQRLVETGQPQAFETIFAQTGHWFFCSASALRDDLYSIVAIDISELKRAEQLRRESEERLQDALETANRISRYMETVREKERKYIAREIHDELGQALTALKIDLYRLKHQSREPEKKFTATIDQMSALVSSIIRDVQRISAELRPRLLDDLGLIAAIEWLSQEFSERMNVPCTFDARHAESCTGTACATAIFRIVQESLTNICRHAQASHVAITLDCGDGKAFLEIVDDGIGVSRDHLSSEESLGLLGIMERAYMCGGKADIFGEPGKGTTVTAVIPCSANGAYSHEDTHC